VVLPVFFPQQFQRQVAVLLQLSPDPFKVRQCPPGWLGCGLARRKQCILQVLLAPLFAQRPPETGALEARQVLVHRTLAHARATGDLPLPEPLLEVQPQDLFDLSHGLSLSGQLRSALLSRSSSPAGKSNAAPPPFSFHSDHCSPFSITFGPTPQKVIGFTGEH
jgi:hypothetical protein